MKLMSNFRDLVCLFRKSIVIIAFVNFLIGCVPVPYIKFVPIEKPFPRYIEIQNQINSEVILYYENADNYNWSVKIPSFMTIRYPFPIGDKGHRLLGLGENFKMSYTNLETGKKVERKSSDYFWMQSKRILGKTGYGQYKSATGDYMLILTNNDIVWVLEANKIVKLGGD